MAIEPEANRVETTFTNTTLSGVRDLLKKTMQGQHDEFGPTCYAPVDASCTPCYPRPTWLGMYGSWRRFLWWG